MILKMRSNKKHLPKGSYNVTIDDVKEVMTSTGHHTLQVILSDVDDKQKKIKILQNKYLKYTTIAFTWAVIFTFLGYAWAANSYLKKINSLEADLRSCQQIELTK